MVNCFIRERGLVVNYCSTYLTESLLHLFKFIHDGRIVGSGASLPTPGWSRKPNTARIPRMVFGPVALIVDNISTGIASAKSAGQMMAHKV